MIKALKTCTDILNFWKEVPRIFFYEIYKKFEMNCLLIFKKIHKTKNIIFHTVSRTLDQEQKWLV